MALIILAVVQLAGVLIILVASAKAPRGYEDDKGFHHVGESTSTSTETQV